MKVAKESEAKAMTSVKGKNKAEQKVNEAEHPFLQYLNKVLGELDLQRCAHHGGALVGKDGITLLTIDTLVAEILKPTGIVTSQKDIITGSRLDKPQLNCYVKSSTNS